MSLTHIPHIIPVLSGKGGVGKSSVTVQLALTLTLRGFNVGVLDIDLTGPSIPRLFGIEQAKVRQAPGGWLPVEVYAAKEVANVQSLQNGDTETGASASTNLGALHCMSLGFLLASRDDAVIWRGPKKTAMVAQLLDSVLWPRNLDYLLIDTPPGTSDEHISLVTSLLDPAKIPDPSVLGAVIVTTPQAISTADVKKELSFCRKTGLRVRGVIENMAGYVCPCCGEVTNVFSKGGGEIMAREWDVRFLGSVPIDGEGWSMLVEEGKRPVYSNPQATQPEGPVPLLTENEEQTTPHGSQDSMAEKYTWCHLFPSFRELVKPIVEPDHPTSGQIVESTTVNS